jgi:hypothetical protein
MSKSSRALSGAILPPVTGAVMTHDSRCSAVQAHQPVTTRPVDLERNRLARLQHRAAGRKDVQHPVRRLPFARVDDRHRVARRTQQPAAVARLAAALGIEHGAVELDATLAHRQHPCGRGAQVGVLTEQQLGRRRSHGRDRPRRLELLRAARYEASRARRTAANVDICAAIRE